MLVVLRAAGVLHHAVDGQELGDHDRCHLLLLSPFGEETAWPAAAHRPPARLVAAQARLAPVRLENSFEVPASPEEAWDLLNDVPRVVPCLPGAELTRVVGEDAWQATMHVKLGPIALQFLSDVQRVQRDEAAQVVQLEVKAREAKGRGGARATIESRLADADPGTRVSIVTELVLQGAVAQYGRGVVGSVAEELTGRFATCLASLLEQAGPAPQPAVVKPVGGLRLALQALWSTLMRPFRPR
ncbi:MAG: carbon monoxide dehydrogenase [Candidatus Rokuibacteriota bacterium]|nr:MAG: carbon monoxide dehydrogenase [Candidatus Rokubacteria bacterium]